DAALGKTLLVAGRDLRLVENTHPLGGLFQRGPHRRRAAGRERIPLLLGQERVVEIRAVEPSRQLAHRGVAARAHVGHDARGGHGHLGRGSRRGAQVEGLDALRRIGEVEQADHGAPPRRSRTGSSSSSLSRYEARFTTSRALTCSRSSTTTRPFCSSVRPVSTRSTIASARFATAASSTDPESRTMSTGTPRRAKARAVRRGYLVATRKERPTSAPFSPL